MSALPSEQLLAAAGALTCLASAPAAAADYLTEEEALAAFFPGADSIERELGLVDDPEQLELRRGRTPRHLFRHVARAGERVLGYAVVHEVMGKARPITYLLAVDAELQVLGIEVLVYRESHGHEISRAAFRRQFVGKDAQATLKLDQDVRNIAGATISCRAITDGVADLLDLLERVPAPALPAAPSTEDARPEPGGAAETDLATSVAGQLLRTRVLMSTPLSLSLPESDRPRAELIAAGDAVFAEVRRLEALLSAFRDDSDVGRVNAQAGLGAVAVAPETLEAVGSALALAERTGGAYDPAVGALTRLFKQAGEAPAEAALVAARQASGWHLVRPGEPGPAGEPTLQLTRRGARLDLGGSAKGYALDRAAGLLRERGLAGSVLNFGGQVLVVDAPEPVSVASRGGFGELELRAGSVATSGDAERAVPDAIGGRRSHLLDPRSGSAVPVHGAVQVFAATALEADALATALYVLGPEAGWDLCLAQGIAARFEAEPTPPLEQAHEPAAARRATPAWLAQFESRP